MTFYLWLVQQHQRTDRVGVFARHAILDAKFPRQSKHLYVFLAHVPSSFRESLKSAHREWRKAR